MKAIANELERLMGSYLPALQHISEPVFSNKPSPAKWSKKEIVGHLADSAQNNIRRFITAQYEENPFIKYAQDTWVSVNGYQQWDKADIISLWYLLNRQICFILRNTPPEMYTRTSDTGEIKTIEWLAADYIRHLKHHMHVVLDLEPYAYP